MIDTTNIRVRRYNGQCEYGPWLPITDGSLPAWLADAVANEIAEDHDDGTVDQAGTMFRWRKA